MTIKYILDNPERSTFGKIRNIGCAFFVCLMWMTFITWLLPTLYNGRVAQFSEPSKYYTFFMCCIVAPIWEELAFRVAPLKLAKKFGEDTFVPIIIISSVLFGWGHGYGAESLLMQGVMGLVFSYVYLKNGFSAWSSMTLHALWNFMVIFGLPQFVK